MPDLPQIEARNGVTYATHDGVALAGDLYLPKGAGPFPALVGVHGGGWVQAAPAVPSNWGRYLASRGMRCSRSATASQEGTEDVPACGAGRAGAVQFVRGNAKQFNLAPDRIGVFGHSAGGNLGALAALGGAEPDFRTGYPQDPHAKESTEVKVSASTASTTSPRCGKVQSAEPEGKQHREVHGGAPMGRIASSISMPRRSATRGYQ